MPRHPLHRRVGALVVAGAMAAAIALPLLGLHVPDRDVDALALRAAAHHSRTQFERVIPGSGDEHCLACHLLRALSAADADGGRYPVPPIPLTHRGRLPGAVISLSHARGLPPRAPPLPSSAVPGLRSSSIS